MFSTGLSCLILASALLLSSLQGWALHGGSRALRHLVAWLAGSVLVAVMMVASWRVVLSSQAVAGGLSPHAPVPSLGVLLVLTTFTSVCVAGALGAGALHARRAGVDSHETARDLWLSRAVVQGIALVVGATLGALLLVAVAFVALH